MKKNASVIRTLVIFLAVVFFFSFALSRLEAGQQVQGRLLLEDTLRKTAVACYASQGFYPPNVAYMQEHYALQWDPEKYIIHYEIFASNLMPDITVLDRHYDK